MKQNSLALEQKQLPNTEQKQKKVKQPLWKLIVLIVSLTLIAALIITIIVFACVKIDLKPNIDYSAQGGIVIVKGDNLKDDNLPWKSDEYLNVVSKFQKGFKTSLLNGFTQGIKESDSYYVSDISTSKSSIINNTDVLYALEFDFNGNEKNVYNPNGTIYKTSNSKDAKYTQYIVVLTESNKSFSSIEIWLFSGSNTQSNVCLTGYGNFNELIKYLDGLKEAR